jgi:hypothetical protein
MRLDKQCFYAGMIMAAVALGACRSGTPDAGTGDSAAVPAQTDTSQPASSGTTPPTIRSDSVLLRTDKATYKAGEQIALTLENKSASGYAFNPCTRSVEREDGTAWTAVAEPDRMCTMEAWILDPRGTRTGNTELPTPLVPGRYRVVVRLTVESPGAASNTAITAVSDPITVS